MTKVTYKTPKRETGLRAVGYSKPSIDCKIKRQTFGQINAPNWQTKDNLYSISIMIMKPEPDDNPNCDWKWITFGYRHDTPEAAKAWLDKNIDAILAKHTLRFAED